MQFSAKHGIMEKTQKERHPFDHVMMFKVLVLQRLFNLSDDQTEYQITDRISFQRFLGLSLGEKVPDAKTIWLFRNTLTTLEIMDELFSQFNQMLEAQGIITTTPCSSEAIRTTFRAMRRSVPPRLCRISKATS